MCLSVDSRVAAVDRVFVPIVDVGLAFVRSDPCRVLPRCLPSVCADDQRKGYI